MLGMCLSLITAPILAPPSPPWTEHLDLKGAFVEACSCRGTCAYETTGQLPGCQALGGYRVDQGSYGGRDISGVKFAFASTAAGDVFVYLDASPGTTWEAAAALCKALFSEGFGQWHPVRKAKIEFTGARGAYRLLVNDARLMELVSKPVLGGDGKGFVVLNNVFGQPYDMLAQGTAVRASFSDSGQAFSLKDSSAFFVDRLVVRKRV